MKRTLSVWNTSSIIDSMSPRDNAKRNTAPFPSETGQLLSFLEVPLPEKPECRGGTHTLA